MQLRLATKRFNRIHRWRCFSRGNKNAGKSRDISNEDLAKWDLPRRLTLGVAAQEDALLSPAEKPHAI